MKIKNIWKIIDNTMKSLGYFEKYPAVYYHPKKKIKIEFFLVYRNPELILEIEAKNESTTEKIFKTIEFLDYVFLLNKLFGWITESLSNITKSRIKKWIYVNDLGNLKYDITRIVYEIENEFCK